MNNERSALLLGNEALEILKNKTVLVVGIGGVGSFCVEALARTGFGHGVHSKRYPIFIKYGNS